MSRRQQHDPGDFEARLRAREAALGLAVMPDEQVAPVAPVASPQSDAPVAVDELDQRDRFGNRILGERGPLGQHRVVSAWDGRTLRVCGVATSRSHLASWEYDAGERRMVCRVCWPEQSNDRGKESSYAK